jgi:hypothetical protein
LILDDAPALDEGGLNLVVVNVVDALRKLAAVARAAVESIAASATGYFMSGVSFAWAKYMISVVRRRRDANVVPSSM